MDAKFCVKRGDKLVVVYYDVLQGQDDWQLGMIALDGVHPGGDIPIFSWKSISALCRKDYSVLWDTIRIALRKAQARPKQVQGASMIGVEFLKKLLSKMQGKPAHA